MLITFILAFVIFQKEDKIIEKLFESTEEGQKVSRNNGDKFLAVFKRVCDKFTSVAK